MSTRSKRKQPVKSRSQAGLWLLILGGLLLVGAALVLALGRGSAGAPRLVVDQEVIDYGAVKLGETVTASFTLTNTGDAPLRFHEPPYVKVFAGC